ncbi:uncharacterized protein LOC106130838 [Amyelois transitella]|uniref:uncharacterized protein LOC106130838 n=1 Tax=Amyelois transitella TaxID=680683 RepID=UPI00298FBEB2|nr:uncharacterized protein LOC106130838 [Amyelois transitella]
MSDVHTVCDIDNTFYKIIEGRPLRRGDDIKVYMSNIRDIFLFKANAAFILDQIIQIDTSYSFEKSEYAKISELFAQCKSSFVQFAKLNYHKSKKYQLLAEVKALELERKSEELDILCDKYVKLRNRLSNLTATFENLSRYRQFLNRLTPIWSKTQNLDCKPDISTATINSTLLTQISFRSGGSFDISNLEHLKVESRPYFVEPIQLLDILEDNRKQCLNYLNIAAVSANIISSVLKGRDSVKAQVEDDAKELQNYVDICNNLIRFEEEKEASYKVIFERILFNEFHELFASFEASKLFTCVQYVNTKIFGDMEDPKDNLTSLMANLERLYMDLSLNLDYLDVEIVKKATNQAFSEDKEKMRNAFKAQRIIKESDILRKSLYASFEPSRGYKKQDAKKTV